MSGAACYDCNVDQIVTPACPKRKDPIDGSLVETYWCPISGSCEQYCFSYLEMQEDK